MARYDTNHLAVDMLNKNNEALRLKMMCQATPTGFGGRKAYDIQLKRDIIEFIIKNGVSVYCMGIFLDMGSKSLLYTWLTQYKAGMFNTNSEHVNKTDNVNKGRILQDSGTSSIEVVSEDTFDSLLNYIKEQKDTIKFLEAQIKQCEGKIKDCKDKIINLI